MVLLLAFSPHTVKCFSLKIKKKGKKKKEEEKEKEKESPVVLKATGRVTGSLQLEDALTHQLVLHGAPGLPDRSHLIAN